MKPKQNIKDIIKQGLTNYTNMHVFICSASNLAL